MQDVDSVTIHLDKRLLPDVASPKITARAASVARVARDHADAVDAGSEFPRAAIDALRAAKMFSVAVPRELGGEGAELGAIVDACYTLAQACASTGMIYAMHQAALACVIRHGIDADWHRALLRRAADDQLLFASSTTEGTNGGNVRVSDAALVEDGTMLSLSRAATVMSYGAEADAIVSTARRAADAGAGDQVAVVLTRDDLSMEAKGSWDVFGMRGTCSGGFDLKARVSPDQILPGPYSAIHANAMVPVSHLAWAAVWAGIAAAALVKAQLFVRMVTRKGGTQPPGAALATCPAPRVSPAPPTFSIRTGFFSV